MSATSAKKIHSIGDAAAPAWLPDGRLRRATPPPRLAPEVLLRSPLFLTQQVRTHSLATEQPATPAKRSATVISFPGARVSSAPAGMWRRQDKYYAVLLIGLAMLAWWSPF